MWSWIIGFVVIVGIIAFVMNRRGSTGAGRDHDQRAVADHRAHDSGLGGPSAGGDVAGGF